MVQPHCTPLLLSVLHGGRRQIDVLFAFYFTYHLISSSSSLVPETHAWDSSCIVFHHYIQNQLFSLRILIASVQKFPCILFSHLTIFLHDFASWLLSFDLIFCCFSITLFFFSNKVNWMLIYPKYLSVPMQEPVPRFVSLPHLLNKRIFYGAEYD